MINTDLYSRVLKWNADRDNLEFNSALEYRMLKEELQEFSDGASALDDVEMADALADLTFVVLGSLAKFAHSRNVDGFAIIDTIIKANESKPKERVNGKIIKGDNWQDPKEIIKNMIGKGKQ